MKLHRVFALLGMLTALSACRDSDNSPLPMSLNPIRDALLGGILIESGGSGIAEEPLYFKLDSNGEWGQEAYFPGYSSIRAEGFKHGAAYRQVYIPVRGREAITAVGRNAQVLSPTLLYYTNPIGGWLNRYDASATRNLTVQVKCVDPLENIASMKLNESLSIGVVLSVGVSRPATVEQYCATIFDPTTLNPLGQVVIPNSNPIDAPSYAISVSPDGSRAYVVSAQTARGANTSTIHVIDVARRTLSTSFPIQGRCNTIAISLDGSRLYLTSNAGLVVFDIASETPAYFPITLAEGFAPIQLALQPTDEEIYIVNGNGRRALIDFHVASGTYSTLYPFNDYDSPGIVDSRKADPQFTPDGHLLLVMGGQTEVVILNTETNYVTGRIPLKNPRVAGQFAGLVLLPF